jgi:hypothetical protein
VEYPWSTPKPLDRLNGLPRCHPRWTVATNAAATRNITRHPRAVVSLPRAGRFSKDRVGSGSVRSWTRQEQVVRQPEAADERRML